MKIVSSVFLIDPSRPAKSVKPPRLFISGWWWVMAGVAFLPAPFRAWSADCVPAPPGVVAWWQGEGNANDITGTNSGALSGGVTFTNGEVGQAFNFDGTNGTLVVPDSSSLRLTTQLTIEAWINPRSTNPDQAIIGKLGSATGNNGYELFLSQQNGLSAQFNRPGQDWPGNVIAHANSSAIVPHAWYHVAWTYDQLAMKLYLNGLPVATNVIGPQAIAVSSADLRISGLDNHVYFDGLIDEPSVYNRALSDSEIAAIYNAGGAGKCPPPLTNCVPSPSGLVSWWSGEGNANDIAGANDGTLSNGAGFASGVVGQAFSFDGINDYVRIPKSASLDAPHQLTIDFWMKADPSQPIGSQVVGLVTSDFYGFEIGTSASKVGVVFFVSTDNGGHFVNTTDLNSSGAAFPAGEWHHIAGVYDGARVQLYLDGQALGNPASVTGQISPMLANSFVAIGSSDGRTTCSQCFGSRYFKGMIDEVDFFNRALSVGEIAAIYNAGAAGKCVPQPPNCVPPPSGLVGWWPGQGDANDIAGTNDGTLSNGAGFASGVVGQAFSFDGINDYVRIPKSASLDAPNQLTIDFWMKADPSTPVGSRTAGLVTSDFYGIEIGAVGESNVGIEFYTSTDGGVNFAHTSDPTGQGAIFPAGEWHHVAGTYDGAHMQLYIDGLPWGQPRLQANPISPMLANSFVAIGSEDGRRSCGSCIGSRCFMGLIDEVDIFNRALSASEIAAIYNAGSAGKCLSPRTATAVATVVNGFVVGASITDRGCGYTNTPIVRIIGGGGSGARAVAVVSNGEIIAINFLDAGSGYTNTPVIFIGPPFIPQSTLAVGEMSLLSFTNVAVGTNYQFQYYSGFAWSNSGATFTATSSTFTQYVSGTAGPNGYRLATTPVPEQAYAVAQVINGFVVGATVTGGGSGYGSNAVVSIVGGGGNGATASATVSGGVVTKLTITDAGIGYTSTPTILIAPPPATALWPDEVTQAMELDLRSLSPYQDYQLEFAPVIVGAWTNLGVPFTPTSPTYTQYINVVGSTGYFRVRYVP